MKFNWAERNKEENNVAENNLTENVQEPVQDAGNTQLDPVPTFATEGEIINQEVDNQECDEQTVTNQDVSFEQTSELETSGEETGLEEVRMEETIMDETHAEESQQNALEQENEEVSIKESLRREHLLKDHARFVKNDWKPTVQEYENPMGGDDLVNDFLRKNNLMEKYYGSEYAEEEFAEPGANEPDYEEETYEQTEQDEVPVKEASENEKDAPEPEQQTSVAPRKYGVKKILQTILDCIYLFAIIALLVQLILQMRTMQSSIDALQIQMLQMQMSVNSIMEQHTEVETSSLGTEVVEAMNPNVIQDNGIHNYDGYRKIYLTFDDGPSANTDAILDILAQENVKATFFVVGKNGFSEQYQRIANEGHTLGMHSYQHVYEEIYKDLDSFTTDLEQIQDFLEDVTGVECAYYRFPGGSSNTVSETDMLVFIDYLNENNIEYVDWNISSEDAAGAKTAEQITSNVISQIEKSNAENMVVLFHDSADKSATVEALPEIIHQIKEMEQTVILPIEEAPRLVQHISPDSVYISEELSEEAEMN